MNDDRSDPVIAKLDESGHRPTDADMKDLLGLISV
jgi:hypothetical protein